MSPLPETTGLYDAIRANRLEPPANGPPPRSGDPLVAETSETGPGLVDPHDAVSLVGRDAQLDRLTTVWRDAVHGGRAVAVVGTPGVGRTALTDALTSAVQAADGAVVSIEVTPARPTWPSPG